MDSFNQILQDYIINQASSSVDKNGVGFSRIVVNGIPFEIAKLFADDLSRAGGLSIYGRKIPVVVYDKSIDSRDEPKIDYDVGFCGKDYILNLRNTARIKEMIIVLTEGTALDQSNESSHVKIGISEGLDETGWLNEGMVEYLVKNSLRKVNLSEDLTSMITQVLKSYKNGASRDGDHLDQWHLIRKISAVSTKDTDLHAKLGLINGAQSLKTLEDKLSTCRKIFSKIADCFAADGVSPSIKEWLAKDLDDEVKHALKLFKRHYLSICDSSSLFINSPYYYYSELQWKSELEDKIWWEKLTIDVWIEILEDFGTVNQGSCQVSITNNLFTNNKPCPVVLDEVMFEVEPPSQLNEETINILSVSNRRARYEQIATIPISRETIEWNHTPNGHKSPTTYRFSLPGYKDVTQRVISLFNYDPGFVYNIFQFQTVKPLKEKKDKRLTKKIWISTAVLSNSGSHELEFFFNQRKLKYLGAHAQDESQNKNQTLDPVLGSKYLLY